MPPAQHHPQGCSLPASLGGTEQGNCSSTPKSLPPADGEAGARAGEQIHRAKLYKSCTLVKRGFNCALPSHPLQWFIAFEGSAMGPVWDISVPVPQFSWGSGATLRPYRQIQAAGHQLDSSACISSSNKDRNRHEHISPRSENSNKKFLKLSITKTWMVKVKAYKFIANSLTTNCLYQISYISMPRATSKGTHAQHGAKITNRRETWNWVFSSQVLQSAWSRSYHCQLLKMI